MFHQPRIRIFVLLAALSLMATPILLGQLVPPESLPLLEAKTSRPAYFWAQSHLVDPDALGGFMKKGNFPRRLEHRMPPKSLTLLALPEKAEAFEYTHRGFQVLLANTTGKTLAFSAADSRLTIFREALNSQGEWKSIEHFSYSFCGNSSHTLLLPSGYSWTFAAPVYSGTVKTQMRFVFRAGKPFGTIYSNTFEGWIHPGQFTPPAPDPWLLRAEDRPKPGGPYEKLAGKWLTVDEN